METRMSIYGFAWCWGKGEKSKPLLQRKKFSTSREKSERLPSQPSAKCDLETYTLFLLAESKYPGCTLLAEILEDLSHEACQSFPFKGVIFDQLHIGNQGCIRLE